MHKSNKGFSLIELMIVVAIVVLLARIALPAYSSYVTRAARAQARAVMLNMAQLQERQFTDRGVYVQVDAGSLSTAWGATNWSGSNYSSRKYDVTVAIANSGATYTITAAPANGFSDSLCGSLTLTNAGVKGSSAGSVDSCWK